ncbi:MAG: YraN family protein [Bacteroidia bacterium]
MAKHNITGREGEEIAAAYLKAKGYQIIEINKRFGRAEIDIIAKIGNEYVFVEVKTRTSDYFGFPEEAIDNKKIKLLGKAAEQFCLERKEDLEIRYDMISLVLGDEKHDIIHIEDAFFPGQEEF